MNSKTKEAAMARTNDVKTGLKPKPLVISRSFAAPRDLVFKAWSSAEHMKRWFSPAGYTVPEAEIDFRPGGVCAICMRSPEGQEFWSRGTYIEISPPDRLVFTAGVVVGDARKFTAHTTVTFEDEGTGTRMTVRQDYDIHDEAFLFAVEGAPEGWRTTLDKLEQEVARIVASQSRSVVHAIFSLERIYDASPAQVFRALSDKAAKARWFEGGGGWAVSAKWMSAPVDASARRAVGRAGWSRPSTRSISTSCRTSGSSTRTRCTSTIGRSPSHWPLSSSRRRARAPGSWSRNRAPSSTAMTMPDRASTAPVFCSIGWGRRSKGRVGGKRSSRAA
jgi:uncharacterized protein YndB with AHSA1/START domain